MTRHAVLLAGALVAGGCLDQVGPLNAEVGDPIHERCVGIDSDPDRDIRFRADVLPLFTRRTGGPGCGCHQPGSPTPIGLELGGLDLSSYAGVSAGGVNSRGRLVVPGDPCGSVIVLKTGEGPPFGARMPFSGPPFLGAQDRQTIIDWIAEGGRDD